MSSSIKPPGDTSARAGLWMGALMITALSVFGRRHIREVLPEVIPPDEPEWPMLELEAVVSSAVQAEAQPEVEKEAWASGDSGAAAEAREEPAHPREWLEHRPAPAWERADAIPAPPQAEGTADEDDSSGAAGIDQPVEWTCDISFWRGYRRAAFYARIFEDGEELAVAESAPFRPAGNGLPERTEAAQAAFDELCAQLEREGWTLVSRGSTWFDATYQRDLMDLAEPVPE